jgi:phage tail sheath protein FI
MAFFVSPGVNVSEIDLTTVVPAVSASNGGLVGQFAWGPCDVIQLIDSETDLVNLFEKPNDHTHTYFLPAASFLAYSNNLNVVRVVDSDTAVNACSSGTAVYMPNDDVYDSGDTSTSSCGDWLARYPGTLGNNIRVSVCPSASAWASSITGVFSSGTSITCTGPATVTAWAPGSWVTITSGGSLTGESRQINTVSSVTAATLKSAFTHSLTGAQTATVNWEFYQYFTGAPGSSSEAAAFSCTNDEMHIAVVDQTGRITGSPNYMLEKYSFVSKATDAKSDSGETNFYKNVINNNSEWIRWANTPTGGTNWDAPFSATTFTHVALPIITGSSATSCMSGGLDGYGSTTGLANNDDLQRGWLKFLNAEDVDVSILITANANATTINYVHDNIAAVRRDCVVVCSPEQSDVVNNYPNELADVVSFRETLSVSSYLILDSGWKQMYDRYNDVYRYTPLNGDIAGLMARTDNDRDPWWSPAGLNRGIIKNVVKLAWNPNQSERDSLYASSVNPVVTFKGEGTVLWGDKTNLTKPSAFDRINVRRLFIVLQKAISTAAKYSLFEFNDEFTRAQFKNMVEPFLRDVQGRRGIEAFKVVCDESNNTAEVIDNNEFRGDIYIKPARSINYVQLNFIAVRSGVSFEEIVGAF